MFLNLFGITSSIHFGIFEIILVHIMALGMDFRMIVDVFVATFSGLACNLIHIRKPLLL